MYLNKNTFAAATCTALLLVSCQDYELESTAIASFKQAYDDNFVTQVGGISPEQSWDFSTVGGNRGQGEQTRAITINDDGWYYPEEKTLTWMKNELKEAKDNSSKCQDFFLSWTPGMTFDIVPIYEGLAAMNWDLYMKVTSPDGTSVLSDKKIWSKGQNVQLYKNTSTKSGMQYEEDEICIWFEQNVSSTGRVWIWPYREDGNTGAYYTGKNNWGECEMTKVSERNGKNVYKWTCSKTVDKLPTKVEFIIEQNGTKTKVNNSSYDFRNHGYYYEDNPSYSGHDTQYTSLYTPSKGWSDFASDDNAQYAEGFRAKKIAVETSNEWPLGSIVIFYLKITDNAGLSNCASVGDMMTTLNKQIAYLNVPSSAMPTNVDSGEGVVTGILGVEDSKISKSGSDKDYNDVVFLINGVMPAPVIIDQNPSVSTLAEKRYMAEDLTDTGDMDFNDIVVDVKDNRVTYWTVSDTNEKVVDTSINGEMTVTIDGVNTKVTITNGIGDYQTATVRRLCGTVPIRFKVGNTLLPWVTNPVNAEMAKAQLEGTYSGTIEYGKGNETTPGNCPDVTLAVTGWNPSTNNVVVIVGWDAYNQKATQPATDSESGITNGSNWTATFPERGTVPCIIATDVTDMWTDECVDITSTGWWKSNFITTGSSK